MSMFSGLAYVVGTSVVRSRVIFRSLIRSHVFCFSLPRLSVLSGAFLLAACAGEPKNAEAPPSEPVPEPAEVTEAAPEAQEVDESEPSPSSSTIEPEFKPGMSVTDAVNAVPQGTDRVEIEQEVLVAPLMQTELYQPCSLKGNQHFSVKVAIWDGRVVGLDVETQPKNANVDACLRRQIEGLTWKKKAKSLSTVEFSY
jgi:hypothetical protein